MCVCALRERTYHTQQKKKIISLNLQNRWIINYIRVCVCACVVRLITREQLNQTNLANLVVCKVIRTAAAAVVLYYRCNRYNNTSDFSGGCLAWK